MRNKPYPIKRWAILLLLMVISPIANATDVRGRVEFRARNGMNYPMNGAFVQFCIVNTNNCAGYTTGYDGMYYLRLAPGAYYIVINGRVFQQISVPNTRNIDIPPIIGN